MKCLRKGCKGHLNLIITDITVKQDGFKPIRQKEGMYECSDCKDLYFKGHRESLYNIKEMR